ncbi:hypothetical protein [Dankookia sp. P2]|uniref:hypothetical protein n=1 Tax=Dankookia sp. P2 TaxID=3423955 RepID=UPI003D668B34
MSQTLGRPSLTVAMAGMPLPPAVAAKVTYVVVQQLLGLPAAAEIDLAVAEADLLDIVAKGRTITLRVGDETLFDGRIEAVTYSQDVARGQVLQLRAHDALSSARRRCAMVARENASSATLGAEIAGRLGLDFRCDADPAIRPLLFQTGQSELDLLVRVAAEDGLYPVVTAGTLRLTSLEGWGTPLTLRLGRGCTDCASAARTRRP